WHRLAIRGRLGMAETWAAHGGLDAAPVDLCVTGSGAGRCRLRLGGRTRPGGPATPAVPGGPGGPGPRPPAPLSRRPPGSPSRAGSALSQRVLRPGMRGRAVRLLQRRLAALKYYPGRVNGRFGSDTLEAVWAFQETQGLPPRDAVSPAMQRALASPRPPKVLVPQGGRLRVE